jgi:hypothetical protein
MPPARRARNCRVRVIFVLTSIVSKPTESGTPSRVEDGTFLT